MADRFRACGFCGQDVNADTNAGHAVDCARPMPKVEGVPVEAPSAVVLTVSDVDKLTDDVKRWRGNLDVMGEEMLEKALRLIPVLERLAMHASGTRSGPNVQIRAAQTLVDMIERILKMVEAHKETT